jgi:hypothetical protein
VTGAAPVKYFNLQQSLALLSAWTFDTAESDKSDPSSSMFKASHKTAVRDGLLGMISA